MDKPKIKDKILFFWNLEGETDISKTNGHYPYESEIVTITSEDDEYYYSDEMSVEIMKKGFDFHKINGINNLWIQINKEDMEVLEKKWEE
jgi:phage-related tail protein|tara:strand:+ start:170 stop:439 length:270 start_codon:yes stop_codon:yes gene_type:complete